ncbi:acyl-CoA N-acyltransferase [Myxozyma melibiosi]|uniref:N-alpha-acetyltransferase 40 n=1 Tax=Myxozyma melibiosi TaxID=54550 RepID=A0ABR1FEH4_9ASCO
MNLLRAVYKMTTAPSELAKDGGEKEDEELDADDEEEHEDELEEETRDERFDAIVQDLHSRVSTQELNQRFGRLLANISTSDDDDGQEVYLTLVRGEELAAEEFAACFEIMKKNMMQLYKSSTMGWTSRERMAELKEPGLIYILIKSSPPQQPTTSSPLGFASFMATWENDEPVVYCYELQLPPQLRGKGLGRRVLEIIETVGASVGLPKCMLTVFSANPAYEFYTRMGYTPTDFSPEPTVLRNKVLPPSYWILEKTLTPTSI